MKSEEEIQDRLVDLKYERFLDEYRDRLSCRPKNCVHNYRHEEDGEEIGLCMLGAEDPQNWPGNVCDDVETAKMCPFFEQRHDEEDLKEEFESGLDDDIQALEWVLDDCDDTSFSPLQVVMLFVFKWMVKCQMWMRL